MSSIAITSMEKNAIFRTMAAIETGKPTFPYDLLVVLQDHAGISYGAHQATENGGSLYKILRYFTDHSTDAYAEQLRPYVDLIYDGNDSSKKGALTYNKEFQRLLIQAARNSPSMRQAQHHVFDVHYFQPAMQLCAKYELYEPLSLLVVYDSCIQSGPGPDVSEKPRYGAAMHLHKYNDTLQDPWCAEEDWVWGYTEYRYHWLSTFVSNRSEGHTQVVRSSCYRVKVLQELIQSNNWSLAMPYTVTIGNTRITIDKGEGVEML